MGGKIFKRRLVQCCINNNYVSIMDFVPLLKSFIANVLSVKPV